jgi:hypothetical protein
VLLGESDAVLLGVFEAVAVLLAALVRLLLGVCEAVELREDVDETVMLFVGLGL